jgi:hypothetical protein
LNVELFGSVALAKDAADNPVFGDVEDDETACDVGESVVLFAVVDAILCD